MVDQKLRCVHFSVDDVGRSLRYIVRNRPASIFDLELYGTLLRWHTEYGLKVTLYCFAMTEDFLISEIPEQYRTDFADHASWLRFGFHQKCAVAFRDELGYKAGYDLVDASLSRLSAGKTNILRLHSWYATPEQKTFLRNKGVEVLLYPDEPCLRYDGRDQFEDCGLLHRRTRVWYERQTAEEKTLRIGDDFIVAFTHEWCFSNQREKIEKSIKIYRNNGYQFVC